MSSLFTRGWIALVLLVATPLVGVAQRGGYDADAYPEDNYGDARQEAEPPRLFRGGLMHQLRSVTESVLGESEEERPVPETNRNIPKPPPLNAQPHRNAPRGRSNAQENSRGDEQTSNSAAPNRNWAGQFLVPNYRNRTQAPASRPTTPNDDRSNERRVYLGQRSGQRNVPLDAPGAGPISNDSNRRAKAPLARSEESEFPSGGISLEASDASALSDEAVQMNEGPAEVVVSHVPDVPYVPRKPLPKRDQASSPSATSSAADTKNSKAKTPGRTNSLSEPKPSATQPAQQAPASIDPVSKEPASHEQGETSLTLGSLSEEPKASPSVPSLEGTSLPGLSVPTLTSDAPALEPETQAGLPSLGLSESSLPTMPAVSPTPSTPSSGDDLTGQDATGSLPPSSFSMPGLPAASTPPDRSAAPIPSPRSLPGSAMPAEAAANPQSSASTGLLGSNAQVNSAPGAAPLAGSNQERMRMEVPHVVVKLLGPGDLATGTPTSYELVVQNPDRIALSGLILRLETPPGVEIVKNPKWGDAVELEKAEDGATLLMWNVAAVAAGGSTQLGLDLKASTSRNFAVAIEWTVLPQEGIDELTVKQPDLQVALEGPVDVEKDVANVYRVRVSNPGNAAARNVKVQVGAASQQASQVEIGDLAAGGSEVVEMDLTFEKAGRLEIGANALAEGNLKRNTNIVVNVRQPVLQASLSLPESVLLGGNVFATMELRNSGDGPARKIQAGLMIPPGTEVINPPSGITRQGEKLLWEVEIVPPGQVVTVPIELHLPSAGAHAMKFACVTPGGALTTAEASTTVEAFADLKLLVNDPPTPAPIGAPVVYELTVTNRGTRDARNVSIVAQFSEGIEPQSATGLKNRVVPGQVLFDAIPTIAAGETVKIKLTAKASVPGMHRFRAEVRCEENDARLVEEESTRYLESASRIASPPSTLIQR